MTREEREIERIETLYDTNQIDEITYTRMMHELLSPDWQIAAEDMLP